MYASDSASPEAKADLDGLLQVAMDMAEEAIVRTGEVYPFGVALSRSGELNLLAPDLFASEKPGSRSVLDLLRDGARADAYVHRAVALVSLAEAQGSDAISVELEHVEGTAVVLLTSYVLGEETGRPFYDELTVVAGTPAIWTQPD